MPANTNPGRTTLVGRLYSEIIAYPDREDDGAPAYGGFGFEATLDSRPAPWLSLRFSPRLHVDTTDPGRNRVLPSELWLRARAGPVDLTAGLQHFEWGVSTLFRPTDVLNQSDYGVGFFRTSRLPELAVSARLAIEPVTIEFAWLPIYQHPRYPGGDDVLGVGFGSLGALELDVRGGFLTEDIRLRTMTFAARVQAQLGPVDLEAMWTSGPSRLPAPFLDDLTLRDVVYSQDVVGGAIAWAIGPVVLRTELAWYLTGRAEPVYALANPYPWAEPIPPDYGALVAGAELTLWDLLGDADLTLTVEYLREIRPFLDAQAVFRPWQNDLFVSLSLALDDLNDSRFTASGAVDLVRGDTLLRLHASRHLIADLSLALDAVILIGGDEGPLSLLHSLSDRDSLSARLTWAF